MERRSTLCLVAAGFVSSLLVVAAASPVHGQSLQKPVTVIAPRDTLTTRVPYGDLALATKEGRKALYFRVSDAVNTVCPNVDENGMSYFVEDCKFSAWTGARPQMKRAIELARSGKASLTAAIQITSVEK